MNFFDAHKFSGESIEHFTHLINNITGIWEHHTVTKETNWSAGFYTMLGYTPGEIECSYNNFFEHILYYDDKKAFLKSTDQPLSPAHIRLLTKSSGYQWFESTLQKHNGHQGPVIYGLLTNIHQYKLAQLTAENDGQLYNETGRIAKVGGWEIDVASMGLLLSADIYDIFELQAEVKLTVEEVISFFEPDDRTVVAAAIDDAIRYSKPYDLELLFRTAKNNVIWVRLRGIPIIDKFGKCKTIRGIFQDIDKIKKRSLTLQSSVNLLDDQNKRLQNFAYIVSHNLRSNAGNLNFMVNLFEDAKQDNEQEEIFAHIKTISNSLNSTIGHLGEIVKIQTEITHELKTVEFETIFNNVLSALSGDIISTNARIITNFEACRQIAYIPAYLESIVQNLITNALKYRHPERDPVITCTTLMNENSVYLVVNDNGLGIDLARYGEDVFGMYKTFHLNKDAKGIGLFITRNQVEALGGNIKVESTVNAGTTFTVKLV